MKSKYERGMTLLEVVLVTLVFSILMLMVLSTLHGTMRAVDAENQVLNMDMQGGRTLQHVAGLVRSAILPIALNANERGEKTSFELIDAADFGFGGSNGLTWRTNLQKGMDSIAFVVPVDGQLDGSNLDGSEHLILGQDRGGGEQYLAGVPTLHSNSGDTGTYSTITMESNATNPVSALIRVNSNLLVTDAIEKKKTLNWQADVGIAPWPAVAAFSAIRFVPELKADGSPRIIKEADIHRDLDGNGSLTDEFEVGALYLTHTGGNFRNTTRVGNALTVNSLASVSEVTIPLCGAMVLRNRNPALRTPIFKLVNYNADNIDTFGLVGEDEVRNDLPVGASLAIYIRLLMLDDAKTMEDDGSLPGGAISGSGHQDSILSRWHETVVTLRNMAR